MNTFFNTIECVSGFKLKMKMKRQAAVVYAQTNGHLTMCVYLFIYFKPLMSLGDFFQINNLHIELVEHYIRVG